MSVILIVFVWLPIVGACVQQNKVWKQSYIETSESEIRYYRVIRDGYEDGSTSYIYEGILMTVNTVTSVSVKGNYIYITGDIRKDVFKDREHSKVQSCNLQSIKIPLYFGEQDALINALLGYQ